MPDQKQALADIKSEVAKAIQMLQQKIPGANLEEARRLLTKTAESLKKNKYDEALSLAQTAQLAANPTTEYLLSHANSIANQGTDNYQKQKYDLAISSWQDSLKEYDKVCEVATLRKEQEVIDQVKTVVATIEADIKAATTEKNNHDMLDLISQANKIVTEAKSSFNNGNFNEAVTQFSTARDKYIQALNIAHENKFEDEDRLSETVTSMQNSIEACYLGKSTEMLKAAVNRTGSEKEQRCIEVNQLLASFSSNSMLYKELQQKAFEGIAQAKIEVGMNMMAEAEYLYKKPDYYQAKEGYRRAQEHFNQVIDFTIEHNLEDKRKEVDRLIDACQTNIRDAVTAMSSRKTVVKSAPPKRVEDLEKGIQFDASTLKKTDIERMAQIKEDLKAEYADINWLTAASGENYVAVALDKSGNKIALRIPKNLDRSRQTAFIDESYRWRNLKQRNIVELIQPVLYPLPLLELEYIDGGSLQDLLKRPDALDKKIACQIVNDIGRGLKYAHSQGVVHGDLKPSNILLTKTLEAKITDWSMGKSYTLGYASPEQIQGTEPDSKTDVYQLGILFYEMLCGDNPYTHGLQAEMENRTLTWLPDKLSLHDPELKSIDEICLRCLAKNPSDRPTIQEIRDAIYSYLIEYYHLDLRSVPIQDINSQIKISLDEALLSAKNNKIADLDKTLKNIMPKIARNKQVQDAVSQMKQIKIDINVINVHDSVVRNITFPEGIENNIEIQDAVVADMQILKGSLEDGKA